MSRESRKRPRSYDIFGLFPFYLPGLGNAWLMVAVFMVLQILVGLLFAVPMGLGAYGMDSYFLLTYVSTFAILLVICSNISRSRAFTAEYGLAVSSRHFGRWHPLLLGLLAMVGMLGTVVAVDPVTSLIQHLSPDASALEESMEALMGGNGWLMFLSVAICAPFFEELFVRGILLRGLLTKMRPGWAIFWSALMFAVMHANLVQGFSALVLGMLLGYTYYRTGCLWLTMLMHFANNALSFALMKFTPAEASEDMLAVVPVWGYVLMIVAGLALALLFLRVLDRIPLVSRRGNMDEVLLDDLS